MTVKAFESSNGSIVIHDDKNGDAYVKSDYTVELPYR